MANDILKWIQKWVESHCNGSWEHSYGIKIETLDNPGWLIKIDLNETHLEDIYLDSGLIENNETDWYSYKINDSIFEAVGDLSKLEYLLKKFKEVAIHYSK